MENRLGVQIQKYDQSLRATVDWLKRSAKHGRGGSSTYFGVWGRWAKPYPETTGYIIPTLLNYSRRHSDESVAQLGRELGDWLLSIQDEGGFWHGGPHKPKKPNPSVFNTAQILKGLCALYREDGDPKWLDAASRGAEWLSQGVNAAGEWSVGNYQSGFNPSYYTRVAWPMLEVWAETHEPELRRTAELVLQRILRLRCENGVVNGWGFWSGKMAYTHTIAYTIRGFLESARLLQDWATYGAPMEKAIEKLYLVAELKGGRLPGAFDEDWQADSSFTCLTGNAQVALCLLALNKESPDLRLVNAACKLVDFVCASQYLRFPLGGIRGGVAGSRPVWGAYLRFRYPNWAAKFHCDALMELQMVLEQEGGESE